MTKREQYILDQFDKSKTVEITLDIDEKVLAELNIAMRELNIDSLDEFFHIAIVEFIMKHKAAELKEKYPEEEIVNMYDFYDLEKILKEMKGDHVIVATTTDPVVILKNKEYERLINVNN